MPSNAARGARAKSRTKKWLEAQGYSVVDLEKVYWVMTPKGRLPIKKDQMGADLLAVFSRDGPPLSCLPPASHLWVQVKSGQSAAHGTFPAARREFTRYAVPWQDAQVVMAWPPRARQPRIVVM